MAIRSNLNKRDKLVVSVQSYLQGNIDKSIANIENLLENPLGSAALSGTSFNIDRNYTTKKLKFKKV